ncbi:hypothetical protein [Acaryochloris sp. IP29b_bin.137]|uniref:hypothetical protein n=1 Tax=Acaryochloris sp. IP29b_bin.137 TaxID=2969217 RepID=UPI00262A9141|nr:hypothetical protein [Acaryochloris sp. IP29b_bin.137]
MSQSNIIVLARQGQVDAITYALNHVLQTIAVTGRAIIEAEKIIFIVKKTEGVPPQEPVEKYINNFLKYLQIPFICQVEVYAKDATSQTLHWFSQFSVELPDPQHTNVSSSQKLKPESYRPYAAPNSGQGADSAPRSSAASLRTEEPHSWQDAKKIYSKIPKNVCRLGAKGISQYKQNHNGSHNKSSLSKSHQESVTVSRAQSKRNSSPTEKQNIAKAKAEINFQAGTKVVAQRAVTAGKTAFGFELAFSGLNNFVAVQQGQKSVEDALVDTLKASATAAATTTVVTGSIVAISLVFPPAGAAFATAAPVLKIVGKVNCLKRILGILSTSDKIEGADQIQALMDSYGLDEKELIYRDLEMDDDLEKLKVEMGMA